MHLGPYCLEVFVRYTVENYDCQSYAKTTGTNNHHMYAQFYVVRLSCLVHGKKNLDYVLYLLSLFPPSLCCVKEWVTIISYK